MMINTFVNREQKADSQDPPGVMMINTFVNREQKAGSQDSRLPNNMTVETFVNR